MATMAKVSDARTSGTQAAVSRSRRKRGQQVQSSDAFMRAFADALRDILHDERRRRAA